VHKETEKEPNKSPEKKETENWQNRLFEFQRKHQKASGKEKGDEPWKKTNKPKCAQKI
jgi:hypothetical protein